MSFSASKSIELCEHYLTICNHKENITLSGTKCLLLWILGLASKNMYIYNPTNPRRPKHKKRALRSPWRCGRGQVQVLITILTQRQERARMHNVSHNFFFHKLFFFFYSHRKGMVLGTAHKAASDAAKCPHSRTRMWYQPMLEYQLLCCKPNQELRQMGQYWKVLGSCPLWEPWVQSPATSFGQPYCSHLWAQIFMSSFFYVCTMLYCRNMMS